MNYSCVIQYSFLIEVNSSQDTSLFIKDIAHKTNSIFTFLKYINMRLLLSFFVMMLFTFTISAQGITGVWETIDDESGEPKSHIKIYEKDGMFYGRVVKLLPAATTSTCDGCAGDMNGKSLLEIDIVQGMKPYKDYYSYGTITDPGGGKEYSCNITRNGDKLDVRGYIGFSLLGRTQVWHKVN